MLVRTVKALLGAGLLIAAVLAARSAWPTVDGQLLRWEPPTTTTSTTGP